MTLRRITNLPILKIARAKRRFILMMLDKLLTCHQNETDKMKQVQHNNESEWHSIKSNEDATINQCQRILKRRLDRLKSNQ